MEDDECSDQRPLIKTEECTFAYIKHSNLYVVATTRKNSNIAMLFTLLHKICAVMQEYFKEVISYFSLGCTSLLSNNFRSKRRVSETTL